MSRDYLAELQAAAMGKVTGGDYKAYIKTNLGPAIPVYTGASDGPSLLDTLGITGGLVVTDKAGRVVTSFGKPSPTDPLKALFFWAALGGLLAVFGRGLIK